MVFSNTEVFNFECAIRGMRNPLESWAKSDSKFMVQCEHEEDYEEMYEIAHMYAEQELENLECDSDETYEKLEYELFEKYSEMLVNEGYAYANNDHHWYGNYIGPNDMRLMKKLINGGSEHRKFLRQIFVSVDITAPLFWWKEFDTYRIGVTENSTSTMHTLSKKPITKECFEMSGYDDSLPMDNRPAPYNIGVVVDDLIEDLEALRQKFLETGDKRYWKELVRWLPNGWLQTRTVTMNYENILSMLHQRANHKLDEWSGADGYLDEYFCKWAWNLPYVKYLFADVIQKKDRWEE